MILHRNEAQPGSAAARGGASWVVVWLMAALLVLTLGVICSAYLRVERISPPVRVDIEKLRNNVHMRLLNLSRAGDTREVGIRLSELRRGLLGEQRVVENLHKRHPEEQTDLATSLAIHDLREDLKRLDFAAAEWAAWMDDATLTPKDNCERVLVAATGAMPQWPGQWRPTTPAPHQRIVLTGRLAVLGLRDAVSAPVRPLLHLMNKGAFRLRVMLFPYHRPPFWLYSFAYTLCALLVGYLLCWLGMRLVRPWIAYAGLLYFLVAIVYLTGLGCLYAGLLH